MTRGSNEAELSQPLGDENCAAMYLRGTTVADGESGEDDGEEGRGEARARRRQAVPDRSQSRSSHVSDGKILI